MEFDNLDDLRVLLATAETGGLTSAGKRCGLSTAAVSAALKRLEQSLGVRLFERTTRSVRPTAEGEVMIDHARRALELVAEGQSRVRAGTVGLAGTIRVTAAAVMAREMLGHWLAEFSIRHPHIFVELHVSDAHLELVREGIDLALRHGPLPDSSHGARLLATARRVACASPDYLARAGVPGEPADLAQHECLVYEVRGRPLDHWVFEPAPGGAPVQVRVAGKLVSNDASITQQWGLEGRGIIYQSELALADALASGGLVRLFPLHLGEPAPLYAVLPSTRYVPARVKCLVDYLAVLFGQKLDSLRASSPTKAPSGPARRKPEGPAVSAGPGESRRPGGSLRH